MKTILEGFLDRVKDKSHVLEILPAYTIKCCLKSEEESSFFVLSRGRIEMVESVDSMDIKIEGPAHLISDLLTGSTKLTHEKIVFRGSFRQWLLVDSLLTLMKKAS